MTGVMPTTRSDEIRQIGREIAKGVSDAIAAARPGPVLIVDDSTDDAELAAMELRRIGVRDVETCHDAESALLRLLDDPLPSLVLLDVQLPRMSGLDALAAMRATERSGRIPVVILTGTHHPCAERIARLHGAGYVRKPVTAASFGKVLEAAGLELRPGRAT